MDSITQAALGASVAGLVAPPGYRRKALLVGALLGTLPDMDVLIDYGDAVENFTRHRSFSHSLFVLAPLSVSLWFILRRSWSPVRNAPLRWLAAISLALLTHPLLDAHTAYGTQLFWPLDVPPTMWATIFIVDPMYTLPLLAGALATAVWPLQNKHYTVLAAGVAFSTLYLAWTWLAQATVERHARDSLEAMHEENYVMFSTPTPLNSLLWRIVVRTDSGNYLEGFDSLMLDEGAVAFSAVQSDTEALRAASTVRSVQRLRWFAQDFIKAEVVNDRLVLSDLRMGSDAGYVFSHVVADRDKLNWLAVPAERREFSFGDRAIAQTWQRIWAETSGN